MNHLKRSLGIGLWFMFLTLPLMVVRVSTINREIQWRWANLAWIGFGAFAVKKKKKFWHEKSMEC